MDKQQSFRDIVQKPTDTKEEQQFDKPFHKLSFTTRNIGKCDYDTWELLNYEHLERLFSIFMDNLNNINPQVTLYNLRIPRRKFFRTLYEKSTKCKTDYRETPKGKIEDNYYNYLLCEKNI